MRKISLVAAIALMLAGVGVWVTSTTQARIDVPAADPNADPPQKNCEKMAAQTFRRDTAHDEDGVDYRAHYNVRLNKCLYAETYISSECGE
jgi:hypothetical protein